MQHSVLPQRRYSQAAASRTLPAFSLGKGYARRHSLRESAAATFSATSLLHANYVACCNQCTLRVFDCIARRARSYFTIIRAGRFRDLDRLSVVLGRAHKGNE